MADLWSVSIAFRNTTSRLQLLFSNEKDARAAFAAFEKPKAVQDEEDRGVVLENSWETKPVQVSDNYGTTLSIRPADILSHWVTDLGREAEGTVDAKQLEAHSQMKLQRRLASDPMLRGVALPPQMQVPLKN